MVSIKNNDNVISIIEIKNLIINPQDKSRTNKLVVNTKSKVPSEKEFDTEKLPSLNFSTFTTQGTSKDR